MFGDPWRAIGVEWAGEGAWSCHLNGVKPMRHGLQDERLETFNGVHERTTVDGFYASGRGSVCISGPVRSFRPEYRCIGVGWLASEPYSRARKAASAAGRAQFQPFGGSSSLSPANYPIRPAGRQAGSPNPSIFAMSPQKSEQSELFKASKTAEERLGALQGKCDRGKTNSGRTGRGKMALRSCGSVCIGN